jgi:hypothetical protein
MKKILFLFFSLIISCSTFAQISVAELDAYEVRMMPFDVRLRTAPYTIQTVSKNKPLTTEVLKEYIVSGSSLKFIAQDLPGSPVSNAADARIIISEDGKSIKIRPKDYTANTTPATPIELYENFNSKPERTLTGYFFKGKQLYERQYSFSVDANVVIVMSSFEFDELAAIDGRFSFQNSVGGRTDEYSFSEQTPYYITKPYSYDRANKEIAALPFECGLCYNKQIEINLKYTKP